MIPTDEELAAKFRWFPFLGYRTLDPVDKFIYDIPQEYEVKALTFEWLSHMIILVGKGSRKG